MDNEFRPEDIKKFAEYAKNPAHFIKECNYGFNSNSMEMSILPMQNFNIDIVKTIHENRNSIIKKSRQMHVSQTLAAYCAWNLLFKLDYTILIISTNNDVSSNFIRRVRDILYNYSTLFNFNKDVIINNKNKIMLKNGSSIIGKGPSKDAGHGYGIDLLILDEAAYIKGIDGIYSSLCMNLKARNGKCIIASTPNNTDLFSHVWFYAIKKQNNFATLHLDWMMNSEFIEGIEIRDGEPWSPWYEKMCQTLNYDKDSIRRELYAEFVNSKKTITQNRVNFRLDSEIYNKVMAKSEEIGISLTDYMKKLIIKDLEID